MTPLAETQIHAGIDVLRTARAEVDRLRAEVDRLRAEVDRLRAVVAGIESLTRNTDGDTLNPDAEIPVGEILRFLHDPHAQV